MDSPDLSGVRASSYFLGYPTVTQEQAGQVDMATDRSSTRRRIAVLVGSVALAFGLAGGSAFAQRLVRMEVGNACTPTRENPDGLCFRRLPVGGWPFPYLYDRTGTSIVGSLGFEDDFRLRPFLVDAAVFGAAPAAGAAVLRGRRRGSSASPRD